MAPDAVAGRWLGRRDGLGWPAGWHGGPDGYQPRVAYFILGILYLPDAVDTQTETLAISGLSVGVGIGRIARREARSPDCSSAAFSRPRCCPSSAGCGTIPHDVDVNTQIEAAVGAQGPSSRS